MKDNRLEQEFEEYFSGARVPENVTDDAKKYVKPKRQFAPRFVKFACAAASLVLVCALTLTFALNSIFKNNGGAAEPEAPAAPQYTTYTDADLSTESRSAYSLVALDGSLKFIQRLAVANNSDVKSCSASYKGGKLALVTADVSMLDSLCRDDARIYVEFTETYSVYGELKSYYDGEKNVFGGLEYFLTEQTDADGEPVYLVHARRGSVKYYFYVRSSRDRAYEKYLNFIKY